MTRGKLVLLKFIPVLILIVVIVGVYYWLSKPTLACRSESINKRITCGGFNSIPEIVKNSVVEVVVVDFVQDGVLTTIDDHEVTIGLEAIDGKYRVRLHIPDEIASNPSINNLVSLGVVNKIDFTINKTDDMQLAIKRNKENVRLWSNKEFIYINIK